MHWGPNKLFETPYYYSAWREKVGCILWSTYIEVPGISRELKIASQQQSLFIEVSSHVMGNRHNKGSEITEMALITGFGVVKIELNHVTISAATKNNKIRHWRVNFSDEAVTGIGSTPYSVYVLIDA
jgi:hypothetical protein